MAVTDRGAALVGQLLNDQDVHENVMRAVRAGQDAYGRARKKNASQAASDRQLQARLREAAHAAGDAWQALTQPQKQRKSRGRRALGLLLVGGGVALAANADARGRVLGLLGGGASASQNPS